MLITNKKPLKFSIITLDCPVLGSSSDPDSVPSLLYSTAQLAGEEEDEEKSEGGGQEGGTHYGKLSPPEFRHGCVVVSNSCTCI